MGPSKLLGLKDRLLFVCIGLGLLGFVQSLCFVTALPEAMEVIQQKYQIIEGQDSDLDGKLGDLLSSFYTLSLNLSSLIGPIIGGAMYDAIGFYRTCDFNMIMATSMAIIFFVFNCGL